MYGGIEMIKKILVIFALIICPTFYANADSCPGVRLGADTYKQLLSKYFEPFLDETGYKHVLKSLNIKLEKNNLSLCKNYIQRL